MSVGKENPTDVQAVWQRGEGAWVRLGFTWSRLSL